MDDLLRHRHRVNPMPVSSIQQQLAELGNKLSRAPMPFDTSILSDVLGEIDLAIDRLNTPDVPLARGAIFGAIGALNRDNLFPQHIERLQAILDQLEA